MSWFLLLLQILPTLISIIKEIIDLISKLKGPQKNIAKMQLKELVYKIKKEGINSSNIHELHEFKSKLSTMVNSAQ